MCVWTNVELVKGYWIISLISSEGVDFASIFSAAVTTVAKAFWIHKTEENKNFHSCQTSFIVLPMV